MKYLWLILGGIILVLFSTTVWFFSFRSTPISSTNTNGSFGTPTSNSNTSNSNIGNTQSNGTQTTNGSQATNQKIFQISAGPVVGATLIQTLHPTTTLSRYINQEDGHVYDLPLDVAGAVPRLVSDVTIPGSSRAIWLEQGGAAILQYADGSIVKSVYLGLPQATTSTKHATTRIQFLPDNIVDLAASPDGASVVYLLKTSSGSDGYIARSDGTGTKKVFSLPLSQMLISWPTPTTLLAQTKSAVGVPGIVFSVDTKTGVTSPLVHAQGLSANASPNFALMVYQTNDGTTKNSYVHDVKKVSDSVLGFSPFPEKCIWGYLNNVSMYCASPLQTIDPIYLDLWHQGTASVADSIFTFDIVNGTSRVLSVPGGKDGGTAADILEMALSPNEKYLSYTTKGIRGLWGVRLSQ